MTSNVSWRCLICGFEKRRFSTLWVKAASNPTKWPTMLRWTSLPRSFDEHFDVSGGFLYVLAMWKTSEKVFTRCFLSKGFCWSIARQLSGQWLCSCWMIWISTCWSPTEWVPKQSTFGKSSDNLTDSASKICTKHCLVSIFLTFFTLRGRNVLKNCEAFHKFTKFKRANHGRPDPCRIWGYSSVLTACKGDAWFLSLSEDLNFGCLTRA